MRGLTSMLHERRSNKSSAAASSSSANTNSMSNSCNTNNNNNDSPTPRLGVRRTSSGVRQRTTALHHSSSHTNLNNNFSNSNSNHSPSNNTSSSNKSAVNQNQHRSNKLFDALANPVQAAAAAVAVSRHPGRKRKTCSLLVLALVCLGIVQYSGTMYDHHHHNNHHALFVEEDQGAVSPSQRRARLRSRSPSRAENSRDTASTTAIKKGSLLASWMNSHRHQRQQESAVAQSSFQLRRPNNNPQTKSQILQTRIQNALQAAFVADAASMGTHWIYNPDELKIILQGPYPEFRNPPMSQFYSSQEYPGHYRHGQSSPYGEQLWFVTQYVMDHLEIAASNDDTSATEAIAENDDDASDPGSLIEPMSRAMQQWAETFGGRLDQASLKFLSCRRKRLHAQLERDHNGGVLDADDNKDDDDSTPTSQNGACGANDSQAHFFLKVIPMTCLLVGHPHRRQYVEQAIRVHQNHDQAVLYGLALSDLLERVLLMDNEEDDSNNNNQQEQEDHHHHQGPPPKSLQEALDATLRSLEEEHTDGWLHFALSLTEHHRQHDALVDAWTQARDNADIPMEELAGQVGRTCHMPGALVLALQGLYRAASQFDGVTKEASVTAATTTKPPTSSLTHLHRGYDYYVHALLGIPHHTDAPNNHKKVENTALVDSVRDNILAAGDTCSRAIYLGAVLGAAYGPPPVNWSKQLEPGLADRVSHAAQVIAESATRRLEQRRY